ncbi:MAG: hypothetical protein Q9164_007866, partial [Protoblastenia rupestris]
PSFQGFREARTGDKQACFTLEIMDTKGIMPAQFEFDHLLHPSTLDVVIQTASQAMKNEARNSEATVVRGLPTLLGRPTGVENLTISARVPVNAHSKLVGFATAQVTGYRDREADIMISTPEWPETLIRVHKLGFTGLGDNTDQMIDDDQGLAFSWLEGLGDIHSEGIGVTQLSSRGVVAGAPEALRLMDAQET